MGLYTKVVYTDAEMVVSIENITSVLETNPKSVSYAFCRGYKNVDWCYIEGNGMVVFLDKDKEGPKVDIDYVIVSQTI